MKNIVAKWCIVFCFIFLLPGCKGTLFESPTPVTLTFWHVYGGQTDSPMNTLVEQFNQSVGREKGIIINVTSLSNSTDIHFSLTAAAQKHPGAGDLPDLFTTYPKTALAIGPERLVDWRDYFSEEQREEFVRAFMAEGEISGRLVLLPIAKSSSALFINATIFDQFSKETGVRYEDLVTWEGMFQAAKQYYQWSGGKAFFKYDDWLHYSMMNTASFGGTFFKDDKINFEDSAFQNVWGKLAASAIAGEVCLLGGYTTTAMMTGESLCGVESTASVLYFKDTVTFPDNTSIPLRLKILPVPIFKEGKPLAIQRGGGLGLVKSTTEKEQAAAVFAEWLTAVENNVPFVVKTGYFPVKSSAYQSFLENNEPLFQSEKYLELYEAVLQIHSEYQFYVPPFFESYGEVEKEFSEAQIEIFKKYRSNTVNDHISSNTLMQKMFEELQSSMK
ncbi:extracellular solute-binding protein [Desulfovibrio sp. OttesenSCG-928-M14]|nr:extracellular solute-binding protein [Desulfovibrio sp. OttesenSCG-928-M14]